MNHQHFHQCIFWLYYSRGLLQSKLKNYSDAISSFAASLDAKNYAQLLMYNIELSHEELTNHKQILSITTRNIANKVSSVDNLSVKASSAKLADKYKQIIAYFEELLNQHKEIEQLDFSSMFDITFADNDSQNTRLQYGFAHYHKGLNQIAINKKKEAIESFNIVNKLLPYFAEAYIQKASIFKEQKKFKKALVQYDAAIRLEHENAELYFARSTLLFELGKTDQAKDDFARYQQLLSNSEGLKLYDKPSI